MSDTRSARRRPHRRSDLDKLAATPPTTAAYLAGMFDGEGCVIIAVRDRRYFELHATIASTTLDFLRDLRAEVGSPGTFSSSVRNAKTFGHKPIGSWHMAGRTAAAFLRLIHPWVRMKRKNIDIALQFYAARSNGGGKHEMPFLQVLHQTMLAQQLRKANAATGRSKPFKYNPLVERFGPPSVH